MKGRLLTGALVVTLLVATFAPASRGAPVDPVAAGSHRIVFGRWTSAASSDIFTVRPDGTGLRRLTSTGVGWFPAWSPHGRRIAFTGPKDAIWIMRADGSHPRRVTHPKTADQGPSWSPDGERIVFVRFKAATPPTVIFVVRTDGTGLRRLRGGNDPAWSPDGRWIAFNGRDGIWVMRPNGRRAHRVVSGGASDPSWSPDGSSLAFSMDLDIWVVALDGGVMRQLTTGEAMDQAPAWSPDGGRIAFSRDRAIWTVDARGGAGRKLTQPGKNTDTDPDW